MSQVQYLDDSNFNTTIANGLVLVDFYADWCGPCRMIAPIIEELSTEMAGVAVIAKLDVDKAQETTATYQVMSIPTVILFKNGKEYKRFVGIKNKEELKKLINSAI